LQLTTTTMGDDDVDDDCGDEPLEVLQWRTVCVLEMG
jgi:hypothetical protein